MSIVDVHARDSGAGPALVLLHAFPLSSAMWLEQLDGLVQVSRVVAPDLRGFGESGLGDDEPSLDRMVDDIAALLDRLGLDEVVLGGLSLGGYVAMAFLRAHRSRVRALVLADTKATADPEPAREKRLRIARRLEEEGTPDALVAEVLPGLCGATTKSQRPAVTARVRVMVESVSPAGAAWTQRAMAARPDSVDALRSVDVPALVLWGDEDELATRADADAMAEALPRAQLEVLHGSGHLSAVEVPDAFTAAVRRFLGEIP